MTETEYGPAFYGSAEISRVLFNQIGTCSGEALRSGFLRFNLTSVLYRLCKNHWFYSNEASWQRISQSIGSAR